MRDRGSRNFSPNQYVASWMMVAVWKLAVWR